MSSHPHPNLVSFPAPDEANITEDQLAMRMMEDILLGVQDSSLIQSLAPNVFHMADESMWYPHKYKAYDHRCRCIKDVMMCVDHYIHTGVSTPVFEATKFIFFNKLVCLVYVLNKYDIPDDEDWVSLLAAAIVNNCQPKFLLTIIDYYAAKHPATPIISVDPDDNELLWLSLKVVNLPAFCVLMKHGYISDIKWGPHLVYSKYEEDPTAFTDRIAPCDFKLLDHLNPRNLAYALFQDDADVAIFLINEGIEVDVWNNFPMKLITMKETLKNNKHLVHAMFHAGAKIPTYVTQAFRDVKHQAKMIADVAVKIMQYGTSTYETTSASTSASDTNVESTEPKLGVTTVINQPVHTNISKEFANIKGSEWLDW